MDSTGRPTDASSYYVDCSSCGNPFNALGANWCSCLATERTLVCSGCGKCFCQATRAYRQLYLAKPLDPELLATTLRALVPAPETP